MNYEIIEAFLIFFGLAFVAFEVVLNLIGTDDDTTNWFLNRWSRGHYIFIPFGLGAIAGHLFMGTFTPIFSEDIITGFSNDLLAVVVLFALCLILWLVGYLSKFERTNVIISIILLAGVAYGHFFWSMNIPE